MNALLTYPKFPATFWSFEHALPFVRKKAALPPLGLVTVAALLPDRWQKRLVDTNVGALRDEDLAWADCVFVGGMAVQRHSARTIIGRAAEAGGPWWRVGRCSPAATTPSTFPKSIISCSTRPR